MESRRRKWKPTPVLLPGESHGQGSLVGCCCCPQGPTVPQSETRLKRLSSSCSYEKQFGGFSKKIENRTSTDSTIPLLGIYIKELKQRSQRGIYTPMFTGIFTIAKK